MSIYSNEEAWDEDIVEAELTDIFTQYGILDDRLRRRIVREARMRLVDRATKDVTRALTQRALARGWRPPDRARERHVETMPVPASDSVEEKVIRWARARGEFSVRDLHRASDWFDKAVDVKACLDGLVARGEMETIPVRRNHTGRLPSPRYRAVRHPAHFVDEHDLGTQLDHHHEHDPCQAAWPQESDRITW